MTLPKKSFSLRQYKGGAIAIDFPEFQEEERVNNRLRGKISKNSTSKYLREELVPALKKRIRRNSVLLAWYKWNTKNMSARFNEVLKKEKLKSTAIERKKQQAIHQVRIKKARATTAKRINKKPVTQKTNAVKNARIKNTAVKALIFATMLPKLKPDTEYKYLLIISCYDRFHYNDFRAWGIKPNRRWLKILLEKDLIVRLDNVKTYWVLSIKGQNYVDERVKTFTKLCKDRKLMD